MNCVNSFGWAKSGIVGWALVNISGANCSKKCLTVPFIFYRLLKF
jgi:hypothetical protein